MVLSSTLGDFLLLRGNSFRFISKLRDESRLTMCRQSWDYFLQMQNNILSLLIIPSSTALFSRYTGFFLFLPDVLYKSKQPLSLSLFSDTKTPGQTVELKKKLAIKVLIIVKHTNENYLKLPVCTVCVPRFHLWTCIVFVLGRVCVLNMPYVQYSRL